MDYRTVLGVSDAFSLPRAPGHGFLRYGDEPMARFRSAYVSGVHRADQPHGTPSGGPEPLGLNVYSTAYVAPAVEEEQDGAAPDAVDDDAVGESLLDILVDRIAGQRRAGAPGVAAAAREPPTMDELLGELVADPVRGLRPADPALSGTLRAVFGIVDRPLDQRRDPLVLDLSGAAGHGVVVGGPQSRQEHRAARRSSRASRSPTPRARCSSTASTSAAARSASLRELPHVGGVAGRQNDGAVRRTIAEVAGLLGERERRFAELDIDGMPTYRRAAGATARSPTTRTATCSSSSTAG